MAGTTPIYGLPYPQSSDLVSAYPALGQDLAEDLDGILAAKIDKSLVDYKGDLLVGTSADTVQRLGSGTSGQVLTVNGSTATGLEWQTPSVIGDLTAYSPTWTANSGTPSIGNGYLGGWYRTMDNGLVVCAIQLSPSSTTNLASGVYFFSLPFAARDNEDRSIYGNCAMVDTSAGQTFNGQVGLETTTEVRVKNSTGGAVTIMGTTAPFTMASGDHIRMMFTYFRAV